MEQQKKLEELSKEELINVVKEQGEQMQKLYKQTVDLNYYNIFKRLDYLLEIVNSKEGIFPEEFIKKCTDEIVLILSLPNNQPEEETEKEKETEENK